MKGRWHEIWSRAVDEVSFGAINALQWRARAGAHTAEEWQRYVDRWKSATPAQYYAPGEIKSEWEVGDPVAGTRIFPTPLPGDCPANNYVHVDLWPGPRGWESPVMFMLHGLMSVSDVGYRLWARRLNRLGWGAAFFHLPYHYGRKPPHALSGELALTANLIRSAEGLRQAVVELRLMCRALRRCGVPHVGVWGSSYGGWVGSLLVALEPMLSTAWLLEPITDVGWTIWQSPASKTVRQQLERRGIRREDVQPHLRLTCPGALQPLIPAERILLIAGTLDRVAPPTLIRQLHQRWPGTHYAEFCQGHVGYQLMPESLALVQKLMPGLWV